MGQHMIFYVIPHFGHVDPMGPMVMSFTNFTSSPYKIDTYLSFSTLLYEKKFSSGCSASGPQSSVTLISFLARYKIALSDPPSVLSQKCTFVGGGVGSK